jgi:hypothetical protein
MFRVIRIHPLDDDSLRAARTVTGRPLALLDKLSGKVSNEHVARSLSLPGVA